MPKQVDHESRRRQIADAVCQLADESGLEGVTLRDVAGRAQVSMGAVQRCFGTKEEMLVFALGQIGERVATRVSARLTASPAQSARTALGHAATEVSLVHEEHRAEARVWLAFVAQAAVSPPLAGILRTNYAHLQVLFARLIAEASDTPDPDPRGPHPPRPGRRPHHPRPDRPPLPRRGAGRPGRPAPPPLERAGALSGPCDPPHTRRALSSHRRPSQTVGDPGPVRPAQGPPGVARWSVNGKSRGRGPRARVDRAASPGDDGREVR
ncbi:hypothetical protein Scani_03960 [Streptomyces caniferus]|uniref:HTH tetR-type domain-containing protein n=1 Tax=Streptomyces caniferus TaxID=285557 RepID=A0A640RZ81_9ACTN|nr:hypothetical protein Scani_03960 [Streptomyces caniferus]